MKSRILSFMRKPKLWLRPSELKTWFVILVWCLDLDTHKAQLWILVKRIQRMCETQGIKRRNYRFVFEYLKEAYTISLSSLTGTAYSPKIRVKVGKSGLPLIIPGKLRSLMKELRVVHTAVLTTLCLHRLVPYWPQVSLFTLEEEFTGSAMTLDSALLQKSWERLCKLSKYKLPRLLWRGKLRLLDLQSSGPNAKVSLTGVIEDAFAFYTNPLYLLNLLVWYSFHRGYLAMFSLIFILLVGFPIWVFNIFETYGRFGLRMKTNYHIGRIGVVYNVAGKSRVIGITNYWVQIGLYPLHRKIFNFLPLLTQDGTFDQLKPLQALAEGKEYASFDLTAATDRLPLLLQRDVLAVVTGSWIMSRIWYNLASMPMWVPWRQSYTKYAVGQPMGMYSSWAMLALTHHMVVNAAAVMAKSNASDYAILGDDVVVPADFSAQYSSILNQLGVIISLSKSIVSSTYVEFAKRVVTLSGVDYSVLGPGLILSACRDRFVSASLLVDVSARKLIPWSEVPSRMLSAPGLSSDPVAYSFGICLIRALSMENFKPSDAMDLTMANEWFLKKHREAAQLFFNPMALRDEIHDRWKLNSQVAAALLNRLPYDLWELSRCKAGYLCFLYYILLWFSPYPWVVFRNCVESLRAQDPIILTSQMQRADEYAYLYKEIKELNVNSFDPFDKVQSRSAMSVWRRIFYVGWRYTTWY